MVIGRSDLAGSMGLEKKDVNSKKIFFLVYNAFKLIRSYSKKPLILKMGGSITNESYFFISKLYKNKLINFIETRNVEFKVNNKFLDNIDQAINSAFNFELEWLKIRIKNIKNNPKLKKTFNLRLIEIRNRLNK